MRKDRKMFENPAAGRAAWRRQRIQQIKNKAQMEILGLAIIIVLVIFAVLLYLMFSPSDKSPQEQKRDLTDTKLSSSTLDAMLRTTINCNNGNNGQKYSVTELMQDCFYWNILKCKRSPTDLIFVDSCTFAKEKIETMLDATLKDWGRTYQFRANSSTRDKMDGIENGNCNTRMAARKPAHQPVPLASGVLNVTLRICS